MRRVACVAMFEIRAEIAAELRSHVAGERAVAHALARVAEVALELGPTTAFDVANNVVWVDVTGCAHLRGGEPELARILEARVRALGHACRVAVADGPRIAAAVARFAPRNRKGPLIVSQGKGAVAMSSLPIAALGLDDEVRVWMRDIGLRSCGDLQALPTRSLGVRMGARTHDVMQMLSGDDRAPLDAWRPPEVPEERAELEWGARSTEAITFVVKALCDKLAARLIGRGVAAARLELVLSLDRALCGQASAVSLLELILPVPLSRAEELLAVLRVRLESSSLPAPVLAVTLRAIELAQTSPRTLDMLTPEPKAERALPRLVAELVAELGHANVGILALVDTWIPDCRSRLAPFREAHVSTGHSLESSALEPTRLVEPSPAPAHALEEGWPLMRIEAAEWWRRDPEPYDLHAVWVGSSLGWVEGSRLRGWVD
jgi:protein ImuB